MKSIITVILLVTISTINAQVKREWVSRYNGTGNGDDIAYSIAVDGSGNVYVTGASDGSGTGNYDYATIKYNSSGVQQWVSRYNGPGDNWDVPSSLAVDDSGNVYLTGYSYGSGTGKDYTTIKYNSSGAEQWVQRYNGPGNGDDNANSIAIDNSGNTYVTGLIKEVGKYDLDYGTIKYNSSGKEQWVQRYSAPGNVGDWALSIAVDGSGNVYVTGGSVGGETYFDYATVKYNSSGVEQWVSRYNEPGDGDDHARSIAVDGSGNVYVTGRSRSMGSVTHDDYATIKYNSSGVEQWVQRYNGPGNENDWAYSIAVDGSGNVYVTGLSAMNAIVGGYATIKYNSSGVQQWASFYDGYTNAPYGNRVYSIAVDNSGNVYVAGSYDISLYNEDYATIKYNSAGVEQWVSKYNGPGNADDYTYSIAVDGSGNVYVTGKSDGSGTYNYDYATVKYSQPITGVYQTTSDLPGKYFLSQNYPNPFNPITSIEFSLSIRGHVSLKVFNMSGQEIAVLVEEELNAGTYTTRWDGTAMPGGIYYYRLETSNYSQTRKLVLLK
jgi:uncharacterized delta-60 repeat protein